MIEDWLHLEELRLERMVDNSIEEVAKVSTSTYMEVLVVPLWR